MDSDTESNQAIKKLVSWTSNVSGSTLGGVVGGAVGGPGGVLLGSLAGESLTQVLNEAGGILMEQDLHPREKFRVGAAATYAIERIKQNIDEGKEIRKDGFFEGERSSAEELFEGVLVKSKNSYQEEKIKYIGNLYGNCVFNSQISSEFTHTLLGIADKINYRQMKILQLYFEQDSDDEGFSLREFNFQKLPESGGFISSEKEYGGIFPEVVDLNKNGLLYFGNQNPSVQMANPKTHFSWTGLKLVELMNLKEIPDSEINHLLNILKEIIAEFE